MLMRDHSLNRILNKQNRQGSRMMRLPFFLHGILTEVRLFLNPDECAKIKPIRAEGKGENHVYDCRTGESRKRI